MLQAGGVSFPVCTTSTTPSIWSEIRCSSRSREAENGAPSCTQEGVDSDLVRDPQFQLVQGGENGAPSCTHIGTGNSGGSTKA